MRFDALRFAIKHSIYMMAPGMFLNLVVDQHLYRNAPDVLPFKVLMSWCIVGTLVFSFMAFVRYSKELGGHERAPEKAGTAE